MSRLRNRLVGLGLLLCLQGLGIGQANAQPPCPPALPPNCLPERPWFHSTKPDCTLSPNTDGLFTPGTPSPTAPGTGSDTTPSFANLGGGADIGSTVALSPGGYIDNAIPKNMFRARFDYGFNMNQPDRAEFFYAAWRELSFHQHGIVNGTGTFQTTQGRGPDPIPGKLDYQEVSSYLEYAPTQKVSVFLEVPFRMVQLSKLFDDGDPGDELPRGDPHEDLERSGTNFGGLSDMILGFKYAFVANQGHFLTFQLRTFFPTGYARHALGTGHYSVEPGLLYSGPLAERLTLFGQAKAWIPVDGSTSTDGRDFAGTVLIYGLGVGYDLISRDNLRVTPVAEFVGWTVTNGFESVFGQDIINEPPLPTNHGVADVSGATIVNAKLGVRTYFGDQDDVYIGFGKSLTGARWYDEIIRVEYRRSW